MTTFNTQDAFLLAELAQYPNLSKERRDTLLGELSSDEARQTGLAIINPDAPVSEEIRRA